MLTWLASYPKSGSTWVRAFLAAYQSYKPGLAEFDLKLIPLSSQSESRGSLFATAAGKPVEELSLQEIDAFRGVVQSRLAASIAPHQVIKTHNARVMHGGVPLIDRTVTARAIYVVRNPLDVVDSLADHGGLSIDDAITLMANRRHQLGRSDGNVPQFLDSWSEHVKSWIDHKAFPVLVLRYEDLLDDPEQGFSGLLRFLEREIEADRLNWALDQTRFESLKRKETDRGFTELSRASKSGTFFRRGQRHRWPEVLSRDQAQRVLGDHAAAMQLAGYRLPDLNQSYGASSTAPIEATNEQAKTEQAKTEQAKTEQAKTEPASQSTGDAPKGKEKHLFIPAEWKRWVAENLLRGSKTDDLVRILIENGYPEPLSRLEVDAADSHPYVIAARGVLAKSIPRSP